MLDALSQKFETILRKLRGQGVLTEANIAEALKEVRLALLEADVNFKVVKDFIERVRAKAVGQEVLQSLTPGHQVVKIVWEELGEMMGKEQAGLKLASVPPTVIMMVGLQGAGKTTTCGKLARWFKNQGRRVLLVAADPRRPAAGDQLSNLGQTLGVAVVGAIIASAAATSGPGTAALSRPAWLTLAAAGVLVLLLGVLATSNRAVASARSTAKRLNPEALAA